MTSTSHRYTGQVKWFNTKAGYGFITVHDDGEHNNEDIFVHFSSIVVDNSQYRYLVQGEYVEFDIVEPENNKYKYHAVNIRGIRGGTIMCETRQQTKKMTEPFKKVVKKRTTKKQNV